MYAFVTCVCMHLYIINIMCSAQPEVAAVLDWYSLEAGIQHIGKGGGRKWQDSR